MTKSLKLAIVYILCPREDINVNRWLHIVRGSLLIED